MICSEIQPMVVGVKLLPSQQPPLPIPLSLVVPKMIGMQVTLTPSTPYLLITTEPTPPTSHSSTKLQVAPVSAKPFSTIAAATFSSVFAKKAFYLSKLLVQSVLLVSPSLPFVPPTQSLHSPASSQLGQPVASADLADLADI